MRVINSAIDEGGFRAFILKNAAYLIEHMYLSECSSYGALSMTAKRR
jgi:hypothetical protein